jgi:hypothetical protein
LPEIVLTSPPPRAELLSQLRLRALESSPGMRIVAQGLLGEEGPIDFIGIEADGRVVLVLVGDAGEDLTLVARGLAQRAWVAPRIRDWLQIAPDLGARPEAGIRLVLYCPSFGTQSRSAARALGPDAPELIVYRCVRNGSGVQTLVEGLEAAAPRPQPAAPPTPPPRTPAPSANPPVFRTALTDADLA